MRRTTTLTALLSMGALALGAGPVASPALAAETCDGKVATIVVPPTDAYPPPFVIGTAGDDVIVGSEGDDRIDGAGGNDGSIEYKTYMLRCSGGAWGQARPQIALAVQRARDIAATGTSAITAAALVISLPK